MSETKDGPSLPKSMRHKQILDAAADEPDASISDLARAVPSATPDLVERVLEEHGDPAADAAVGSGADSSTPTDDGTQSAESPTDDATEETTRSGEAPAADADPAAVESTDGGVDADEAATAPTAPVDAGDASSPNADAASADDAGATAATGPVDPARLTPVERETLQAIRRNPEATQRALAEELGVSAATVSQRVSGIEGFEWSERADFVTALPATQMNSSDAPADTTEESIAESLAALEAQVDALAEQQDDQTPFEDPDLAAKIVHACMGAETISEDEELEILRTLLA